MKTALVVDDSRVARAVLRKTLVGYGVAVDEVPSAEAAIEYLKVDRPDVIFLDHQMPGMDGFDALGVLKANPGTATIPVMMYTSQEGQFYVSQARALGAVDVLPKSLAPADVERLLQSHHLIAEPAKVEGRADPIDDPHALTRRIRSLLDEQAARLMSDFRCELERAQAGSALRLEQLLASRPGSVPASSRLAAAASVLALGVAIVVAALYVRDEPRRALATDAPAVSIAAGASTTPSGAVETPAAAAAAAPETDDAVDATALSWSFTRHYPYDAAPLDDERARDYAPLFSELRNSGFAGTVTLDIHAGRYCVNYAADGSAQLAPPDQPAATCDFIGSLQPGTGNAQQSPMFAGLVASTTRDGAIELETVLHGANEPTIDYPSLDYSVTAGDWNSIADANQRIVMRLGGEGAAAAGERFAYLVR